GTGSISMRPPRQRISRVIPGLRPASSRTSLGMTNRPAGSMVAFMALRLPYDVPSARRPCSAMHGGDRRPAPERAVAHPASPALGEVVVHPRLGADADEERDRLHRRHEARLVQGYPDRRPGAEAKQRRLLRGVPAGVAGADPVGHAKSVRQTGLTEEIV